ncbi:hypothetical protein OPV22_021693 [Ensete ventricosum]|uniref:Uncharacterized protein n=1 Tax=Ensete ventricosum TaxID=4639 RepID=A0AAV8PB45_ENSVE|nr:hypothetical protein OPV22_021693 [Ensete ventricosum]
MSRHLHHVPHRLHLEVALQDAHRRRHLHRRGVAQVVDAVLRRAPLPAASPGAFLCGVDGGDAALDDVVDLGEVAGEVDAVLKNAAVMGFPWRMLRVKEK